MRFIWQIRFELESFQHSFVLGKGRMMEWDGFVGQQIFGFRLFFSKLEERQLKKHFTSLFLQMEYGNEK